MSRYEKTPAANRGTNQKTLHRHSSTPINLFLDHCPNARKYGEVYRDACPAHEGTSRSSLSIKETDDGRVLLHCFAGCSALDVVHAVGLELSDLFVRVIETEKTPRSSWQQRELMKMRRWKAASPDFLIEVSVLLSAMGQVYQGYPLSEEDRVRMLRAGRLIRSGLEYL
jgi:hypothetical protein